MRRGVTSESARKALSYRTKVASCRCTGEDSPLLDRELLRVKAASAKRTRRRGVSGKSTSRAKRSSEPRLAPDARITRVAVTFFIIYAVLQAALWALVYRGYFDPVMEWTAVVTGACSVATGVPATVAGNEVALQSRILRIDADCTGVTLMMIYTALVLAYPLGWRNRLIGLAFGIAAIFVANLIRLVTVAQLSGPLKDRAFLFVHDYLFKIVMMAIVIAAWALYLAYARRHATEA